MPNNILDRHQAPALLGFVPFEIQAPVPLTLSDVPVFVLEAGEQDVMRIDLVFAVGSWHEQKALVSSLTNRILQEGSLKSSGKVLADYFDFYGAHLQYEASADRSSVSLYCLSKHTAELLPRLFELVFEPAFPEKEFQTTIRNNRQQLLVEQEKVAFLARRGFNAALFGPEHPYGRSSNDAAYAALTREDLAIFHRDFYTKDRLNISLSGKGTGAAVAGLEVLLATLKESPLPLERRFFTTADQIGTVVIPKPDAVQFGLRLGKRIVDKKHPDYPGLKVLNTVFGGYFGSRLMSNIREDKGYTYGIGSAIASFEKDAIFTIATEVGRDVAELALTEIRCEIDKIRNELIPTAELDTVRSYLQGVYMSSFDGAFSLIDRFWDVHHFGLDYDYYHRYLSTVQNITAEELRALAVTYLAPESLVTVVAGS